MGERLDERRARWRRSTAATTVPRDGTVRRQLRRPAAPAAERRPAARAARLRAPAVAARPDPVAAIPWGMRVAAEAGWRLLVLAGTLWVLMRVISAVQLVVLAFVAALLVTAMLQPTVARLQRLGLPRGLATAVTAILGFVVMGLVGWFVVWQVMDNLDNLSDRVQDGIDELQALAAEQPVPRHRGARSTTSRRTCSDTIGTNTEEITSAGLRGRHRDGGGPHRHPAGDVLDALPALRRQAHLAVGRSSWSRRRRGRASRARGRAPGAR